MWIEYYDLGDLARDDILDQMEEDVEIDRNFEPSMRHIAEWLLGEDGPYEELAIVEYDASQSGPVSWSSKSHPLDLSLWPITLDNAS